MPTTTGVTSADGAVERAADGAAVHAPGHDGAVAAAQAEHAMGEMMHDMGHVPGMSRLSRPGRRLIAQWTDDEHQKS